MEPFRQTLVNTRGAPEVLRPSFFKSPKDFSAALSNAIPRARHTSPLLGIAALLTVQDAFLEAMALATPAGEIFVFHSRSSPVLGSMNEFADATDALSPLLGGKNSKLVGFGMARIAIHIRHCLNAHVRGIELTEAVPTKERNLSPGAFVKNYVDPNANTFAVDTLWDALPSNLDNDFSRLEHLALRAWLSARVATAIDMQYGLGQVVFADTMFLSSKYFYPIHQMIVELEQIEAARPRVQENDFKGTFIDNNGHVVISNDRFSNRVRPSERTEVWMIDGDDGVHRGTARRANGKQTQVATRSNLGGVALKSIFVVGRDEFSHADRARETFILQLLQGKHEVSDPEYAIMRRLYFPNANEPHPTRVSTTVKPGRLNQSQANAVEAMANSEGMFVIVHGPPGTGKTSTISAALQLWLRTRSTVWVVAQSNVAVKNIAERLSKDGVSYRLLVSKEFYHEWHEHIYDDRVKDSLIRTDELPAGSRDIYVMFHEVKIVLCTLSTLSNPSLESKNIFSFVPVAKLVVDEASQIGIVNYMHVLSRFKQLKKVCFFGDPKQLPPFGKESAPTLQSIFDVRHLKSQAYFLNTQYRMPVPLGQFISDAVYDGKLQSKHQVTEHSCVAFIDVSLGEEESNKKSFINKREVQTVEHLVRYYYQHKDYCIVTPYDAQRNLLQKALEISGLRFDNIYNVDSFQGNEADFIIVSVVRSASPGFLSSRNRVNVMLTRCKLGMVIVTGKAFVRQRSVRGTLLGEMCQYWETKYGEENTWHDWKAVAEKRVDLPGTSKGRNKGRNKDGSNDSTDAECDSSRRSSGGVPPTSVIDIHRSGASLTPLSALVPGRLSSAKITEDVPSHRGEFQLPAARTKAPITSVTDKLDQMSLGPVQSTSLGISKPRSSQSVYWSTTRREAPPTASDFPVSLSTPRSLSVGGAWSSGRPDSSRPAGVTLPIFPSQKLTPLRKNVPSEKLPSTREKWPSLF